MYKSYSIELPKGIELPSPVSLDDYKNWLQEQRESAELSIESYLIDDETISCSKIEDEWFPNVEADIFLSHSHADKELAVNLAAVLWEKLDLKVFIDSIVWGYSGELQKRIHNDYCVLKSEPSVTYEYSTATQSTTYINMLLSIALSKMIDKTECLFFLNTDSSVVSKLNDTTHSPWIYTEIEYSRLLRINPPEPRSNVLNEVVGMESMVKSSDGLPNFSYQLNRTHMYPLTPEDFIQWIQDGVINDIHPLDYLYKKFTKVPDGR